MEKDRKAWPNLGFVMDKNAKKLGIIHRTQLESRNPTRKKVVEAEDSPEVWLLPSSWRIVGGGKEEERDNVSVCWDSPELWLLPNSWRIMGGGKEEKKDDVSVCWEWEAWRMGRQIGVDGLYMCVPCKGPFCPSTKNYEGYLRAKLEVPLKLMIYMFTAHHTKPTSPQLTPQHTFMSKHQSHQDFHLYEKFPHFLHFSASQGLNWKYAFQGIHIQPTIPIGAQDQHISYHIPLRHNIIQSSNKLFVYNFQINPHKT